MIKKINIILSINSIAILCYLMFFTSFVYSQGPITLNVGNSIGLPSTINNPLQINLENLNDDINGITMDICDANDYLTCTSIESTERTSSSSFWLDFNEISNGCCRIMIVSLGSDAIEAGEGSIATIKYNVSLGAPEGQCRVQTIDPETIGVSSTIGTVLSENIYLEDGQFCFEDPLICLGVQPGSGRQDNQNLNVVITGEDTDFVQDVTEVSFENPGITVTNVNVDSPTQVTVTIDIEKNAPMGVGEVIVTSGTEIMFCDDAFEVLERIYEITDIKTSNPTSTSISISWVTNGDINGKVYYSVDSNLASFDIAYDDRGSLYRDNTHHVTIGNLSPHTTYYYEVQSGAATDNNDGSYYSFNTMKSPDQLQPNCILYGWVYKEDGLAPADGAIAYLKILHNNEESYWLSTLVDSQGVFTLNLGNLFSTVTDDVLPYGEGDPVFFKLKGGRDLAYSSIGEYTVPATCPFNIGSITLDQFVSLELELNPGFNLIAFPLDPIKDKNFKEITACSLIEVLPGCNQISSWDANFQRWLSALAIDGEECIGDDLPIEPGKGYFVKCDDDTTSTFYGNEITQPLCLILEPGYNLISIPYPQDDHTACSLISDIPGASEELSWDPNFQKWLAALVIEDEICAGDDFFIELNRGYFTHCTNYIEEWCPGIE